jgi:hypothetical protein
VGVVTESEVLSLVRGEIRAAFEAMRDRQALRTSLDAVYMGDIDAALAEIEKTTAETPVEPQPAATGLEMAMRFHETYERLAPSFGYETRADTKAFDPESANGRLMIAVCAEVCAAAESRGAAQQKQRDVDWLRARKNRHKTDACQAEASGPHERWTLRAEECGNAADALEADGAGER